MQDVLSTEDPLSSVSKRGENSDEGYESFRVSYIRAAMVHGLRVLGLLRPGSFYDMVYDNLISNTWSSTVFLYACRYFQDSARYILISQTM